MGDRRRRWFSDVISKNFSAFDLAGEVYQFFKERYRYFKIININSRKPLRTLKGDEKINSFPLNENFSGLLLSYELCLTLISLS